MRAKLSGLLPLLAACAASVAVAAAGFAQDAPDRPGPGGLPAPGAPDTVRTNLWLTEALMAEIVTVAAQALPDAPARILLSPGDDSAATELFGSTAFTILAGRGHRLFAPPTPADSLAAVAAADSAAADAGAAGNPEAGSADVQGAAAAPEVDAVFAYRILGVELAYPQVGRTLGIWKRWVDRRVQVTAMVDVTDAQTGRILLSRKLERSFADRLEAADLAAVDSPLYAFTSAKTAESGWHSRMEEIVVLGTLAGLVAVYFANTTN